MGGVQDTYLRYESAGDMYVGRTVSGLPSDDVNFAILPPHFSSHSQLVDQALLIESNGAMNGLTVLENPNDPPILLGAMNGSIDRQSV